MSESRCCFKPDELSAELTLPAVVSVSEPPTHGSAGERLRNRR